MWGKIYHILQRIQGRLHSTHVYGQIGLQCSEVADRLAKEGSKESVVHVVRRPHQRSM